MLEGTETHKENQKHEQENMFIGGEGRCGKDSSTKMEKPRVATS